MTTIRGRLADGTFVEVDIADGRIRSVRQVAADEGPWILPGLVDLQVNGYAGFDLNSDDLTVDTVHDLVVRLWQHGVTAFCPTIITATEEKIATALDVIARARAGDPLVRRSIPAVHVEGPHISVEDGPRGAHDPEHVRAADIAEFTRWQRAGDGLVGIVTLAPEVPGALDYIRAIAYQGVVAAVGHTAARPDQIHAAADAGARFSTHLGNGAHPMLPRHSNYIWAQLAESRMMAGFIADGHHLPVDTFAAMVRAKHQTRSVLVSDSAALAGQPPGEYRTPVGGSVTIEPDGRLRLTGSQALAGSGRSLAECISWAVSEAGLDLTDIAAMAATNPAQLLGLPLRGAITAGSEASLTILSQELRVQATMIAGTIVYPPAAAPAD